MEVSYSVIIPSANRPEMLKRAVASVEAQTLPPAEIWIVVDEKEKEEGGGEDRAKYSAFRERERCHLRFTGGGKGAPVARNIGLEGAQGEFVFFLDDDDEWLPEKAERQISFLEEHPEVQGVTCGSFRVYPDGRAVKRTPPPTERIHRDIRVWNHTGSFSFFGFRRDGLVRSLRLEESLPACQDLTFYMDFAERGGRIGVVGEPLVRFHCHGGGRISGNRGRKEEALARVLELRGKTMSTSERRFLRARLLAFRCGRPGSRWNNFRDFLGCLRCLTLAGRSPFLSWRVFRFAFTHLRRNEKQS